MSVVSISITEAGRVRAERLPYPHRHGQLAATVRELWTEVDGLVLFCATGIAVRVVAPLLDGKVHDPAVVCLDETGRFAIALCGGHLGGANELARHVGALLGAEPVLSTATDAASVPALDQLPGLHATGDVAGVTRRLLDGERVRLSGAERWPLPASLTSRLDVADRTDPSAGPQPGPHPGSDGEQGPAEIVVSERIDDAPRAGRVTLHPANLVLGIGSAAGVGAAEVDQLVERVLADSGLARASVGAVASIDLKADEAGIVALGLPLVTFPAGVLAAIEVPNPSAVVEAAVGTPSVAEAAALAAAGPGAELVVPKRRSAQATVAVARRVGPAGHLAVVGLGPGGAAHRTPAASTAIRHATHVVGYDLYLDLCRDLLSPHQEVVASPIGAEADRCQRALELAAEGGRVALVCSGDPGVFAMASLALELAPGAGNPPVEIVPGVTASLAAAAVLGAPLGHDHASISLSDLLTPWPVIERRVRAVAEADLVCALYNPRSQRRTHQLVDALAILAAHRPPDCPVGIVSQAGRADERVVLDTLATVDPEAVDMLSIVIVGASGTTVINGRMVTPRGYRP